MNENKFNIETYYSFNCESHINISIFPYVEFGRSNYYSYITYSIFIGWLMFGIDFEYVHKKRK